MIMASPNALIFWGLFAAVFVAFILVLWLFLRARKTVSILRTEQAALIAQMGCDDLTAARSRHYMRSIFGQEQQNGQNTLLFVDLDSFKSVNDGYGHKAGDALLKTIADRMVAEAQDNEIVFRIGGDEFGIYLRDTDLDRATERAEVMRRVIAEASILVDGIEVRRTGSIGVARIECDQDFVGALYYADEAQYAAKSRGGNTVRANAGETLRTMIARRTGPRVEDLAKALSSDEVTYHVQPIFDTRVGRAIGVEALIRWQRPDGRLMMPHQFLSVMNGNLYEELRAPVERARDVAEAFTRGHQDIFCAFNVSSNFLDANIGLDAEKVDQLLMGLTPTRTVLEIVERAVIRNPEATKALLHVLREKGVRVALDDFGTGLSNLERLQELDVDIVKIDRRFVHGIDRGEADIGILRALLDMSHDMHFEIIAEGVETQAELDMLQSIGIWNAQGFFLGRPDTAEHWTQRLGICGPTTRQAAQ